MGKKKTSKAKKKSPPVPVVNKGPKTKKKGK